MIKIISLSLISTLFSVNLFARSMSCEDIAGKYLGAVDGLGAMTELICNQGRFTGGYYIVSKEKTVQGLFTNCIFVEVDDSHGDLSCQAKGDNGRGTIYFNVYSDSENVGNLDGQWTSEDKKTSAPWYGKKID